MLRFKNKGFTLIELLVVIAIIGILAGITLTALGGVRSKARDTKRIQEIRQIQVAMEFVYTDQNNYDLCVGLACYCGIIVWPCYSNEDRDAATPGIQWVPPLNEYFGGDVPLDPVNNEDYRYALYTYSESSGYSCYFIMAGLQTPSNLPEENDCVSGWVSDCREIFPNAVDCVTFNKLQ